MPIRALVAALLLPLPFAALPVLSLVLGGFDSSGDRDFALSTEPGITREFVLTDSSVLTDSTSAGEPFASTAYTPDGRVMAADNGCGDGGLTES